MMSNLTMLDVLIKDDQEGKTDFGETNQRERGALEYKYNRQLHHKQQISIIRSHGECKNGNFVCLTIEKQKHNCKKYKKRM